MTNETKKTMHDDLTAREMVEKWDSGETLFTIEMGGLGPGYEQAIHICVFDIMRELLDTPLPEDEKELDKLFNDVADKVCVGKGYSGAQVGQARNLAYRYLSKGSKATLDSLPEEMRDRIIQVSKHFPDGGK